MRGEDRDSFEVSDPIAPIIPSCCTVFLSQFPPLHLVHKMKKVSVRIMSASTSMELDLKINALFVRERTIKEIEK